MIAAFQPGEHSAGISGGSRARLLAVCGIFVRDSADRQVALADVKLPVAVGRTLAFSLGTRNSFVVLPLASALPAGWEAVAVVVLLISGGAFRHGLLFMVDPPTIFCPLPENFEATECRVGFPITHEISDRQKLNLISPGCAFSYLVLHLGLTSPWTCQTRQIS